MSLQIIGFPRSNFVRAVRMASQEKGVDYELVPETPHSDAVKAIHPLGQIPVMRHGDVEIAESQAILRYIDAVFDGPKLFPEDPVAAAPVNQWVSLVASSVDQMFMRRYVVEYAFNKDEDGNVIRDEIDKTIKRMPRMVRMLDKAVGQGYIAGPDFTVADCFLTPILGATQMFPEGKEMIGEAANLSAYFARVSERPSFAETAP